MKVIVEEIPAETGAVVDEESLAKATSKDPTAYEETAEITSLKAKKRRKKKTKATPVEKRNDRRKE